MSDSSVVVKVADAEAPQNTFVAREANCCWVSTYTTSVLDGTAKLDKAVCCGLWQDRLDVAALRNVVQWRAHTLQAGACARSGNIALQLAGSGNWAMNLFKPALFGGWKDAFKVDAVLRAASLADRPPVPAYLATPEMAAERSWARKTGCCGSTAAACTCCCCETNEQTVRVGPADSLTTVHDKEHQLYCTRGLDVRGTNTGEIGFIAAEAPIGCCGITNDKPDFGSCSCSCDEQAVFAPTASPDKPLSVNTNKGESEVITTNVLSRVLADPEVIAEEKLRTYVSQHSCYGRKGELTITNKRVEYVGYKHPPFCCETVAPGVPNLCCVLCQVHTRQTIPLDKVTDTVVEADGPCKVSHDYATYAWCVRTLMRVSAQARARLSHPRPARYTMPAGGRSRRRSRSSRRSASSASSSGFSSSCTTSWPASSRRSSCSRAASQRAASRPSRSVRRPALSRSASRAPPTRAASPCATSRSTLSTWCARRRRRTRPSCAPPSSSFRRPAQRSK